MENPTTPDHADWRYKIMINRFREHASITLTDRQTGAQVTHDDVPEDDVKAVVRHMVRFADAQRPAGDLIGEAARAALAVECLRRTHAQAPEHLVDPMDYVSVLTHVTDVAAALADVAALGADMCGIYAALSDVVEEQTGRDLWRSARSLLGNVRAGALGADKAAASTARTVRQALSHPFDCGDCTRGECHWGDEGGGRLATARRREAAGQRCGCARHDVSLGMRGLSQTADPDDGPLTLTQMSDALDDIEAAVAVGGDADGSAPLDQVAQMEEIIRVWYATHGDTGGTETLIPSDQPPPVVLTRFDADIAEHMLNGFYPTDPRHRMEPGTGFVNRHGRPLPRYALENAPEQVDDAQLSQVAREVYAKLTAELGDVDTPGSIADVGAALFDIPGRGPLLVPAGADLAMICMRLHADVTFECETRPDVIVVDDPVQPARPERLVGERETRPDGAAQ